MITRAEIAKLTPRGRTKLFDDLSGLLFATQEDCATGLEVTRKTIHNWRTDDKVPLMALYALHSMSEAKFAADLEQVAHKLEQAVFMLKLLFGARPGPSGSAGKNASASRARAASPK